VGYCLLCVNVPDNNVTWYLKLVSIDFVCHGKFDYMKIHSVWKWFIFLHEVERI
jgi:hypothetical protein